MGDDELARWAAEARADEATRSRARERWLRRQAEDEGALAGLALDLAERGATVVACTIAGRRHRGSVATVGSDFIALAPAGGGQVLLALDGLAWLRAAPGEGAPAAGDRSTAVIVTLADALDEIAADRGRVMLVPGDLASAVTGDLLAVGRDVATVAVDGEPGGLVYVRLASVTEVTRPGP